MMSQKDRVVRVRTAPDMTMPEHRSRSVHLGQHVGEE